MPDDPPPPGGDARHTISTHGASPSHASRRLPWRKIRRWAVGILTIVPTVIVAFWIVLSLTILTFHRHSLDLDAIVVPDALSKEGFTSDVATRRLRDAVLAVQALAKTSMAKTSLDTDQDLSAITVPRTGLSLQGIAAAIRSVLPGWQHEISGEFISSGTTLSLRLRLNGKVIFSDTATTATAAAADALIGSGSSGAAFQVVQSTQPYVAASALWEVGKANGDFAPAEDAAGVIIAEFPASDDNVLWATNLKGLIAKARGNYNAARQYFEASGIAVAHLNLGNLYSESTHGMFDLDKAVEEYQTAIKMDPGQALFHNNLAATYLQQKKPLLAVAEYQKAISIDPTFEYAHYGLGFAYCNYLDKDEDGIREYQNAIHLDATDASPHNALGYIYLTRRDLERAIVEFETAIQLNPMWQTPYDNLGQALREIADSPPASTTAF